MVAQPESVPAVRHFVDDTLTTWGRTDLIDDVGLSVTELATNATLHSRSTFFDVEVRADDCAVRVAVVDTGSASADSIALRVDLEAPVGDDLDLDLESMTGRGLFIVSALATRWGIDDLPDGTRVWADFVLDAAGDEAAHPPQLADVAPARAEPIEGSTVIRLLGCPPDLLLAHDDNLADIARELRLFGASHRDREAAEAAERISEIVRLSAMSWDAARLVAKQGVQEGRAVVDIAIASDPEQVPVRVAALREAVRRAEAMAEQGLLITMPAPRPVQQWRDWVEAEMLEQIGSGRDPVPFEEHLADRRRAGR
jgi:anti-sigma regulatory factor (Ser/Thr protein kinase)